MPLFEQFNTDTALLNNTEERNTSLCQFRHTRISYKVMQPFCTAVVRDVSVKTNRITTRTSTNIQTTLLRTRRQ